MLIDCKDELSKLDKLLKSTFSMITDLPIDEKNQILDEILDEIKRVYACANIGPLTLFQVFNVTGVDDEGAFAEAADSMINSWMSILSAKPSRPVMTCRWWTNCRWKPMTASRITSSVRRAFTGRAFTGRNATGRESKESRYTKEDKRR